MSKYSQITSFIRSTFHEPTEFIPLHEIPLHWYRKKYLNECTDSIGNSFKCLDVLVILVNLL